MLISMKRTLFIFTVIFSACTQVIAFKIKDNGVGFGVAVNNRSYGSSGSLSDKLWLNDEYAFGLDVGVTEGISFYKIDFSKHVFVLLEKGKLPIYAGTALGVSKDTITSQFTVYSNELFIGASFLDNKNHIETFYEIHHPYMGAENSKFILGTRYYFGKKSNYSGVLFTRNRTKESESEVSVNIMDEIPTAVYHLMKDYRASAISVALSNNSNETEKYKILYRIGPNSKMETKEIVLPQAKKTKLNLIPLLTPDSIRKYNNVPTPEDIYVEIYRVSPVGDTELVLHKRYETSMLPCDQFCMRMIDANSQSYDLSSALATWVTYTDRNLSEVVSKASIKGMKMNPTVKIVGQQSPDVFTGPNSDNRSLDQKDSDFLAQINLLYDTLKDDYHLTYVNQPMVYKTTQRIKFPCETLKNKGNCIELSVLFASLLESVEFDPIIILFKESGHAVVGWRIKQGGKEKYRFLETNVFGEDFNKAVVKGINLLKEHKLDKEFQEGIPFNRSGVYIKNNDIIVLDIKKLRKRIPSSPYHPD